MADSVPREIDLNGKKISYLLRANKRTRTIRLTVHYDGRFVVSTPTYVDEDAVEKFMREKSAWILKNVLQHKYSTRIILGSDTHSFTNHKNRARAFIQRKVAYLNTHYQFEICAVRVKNHRSQWGSCSHKKNLNFNYRIFFLPERLSDYIIVHELCHLKELNHSQRFWNLVAQLFPDYKALEKELKLYSFG